MGFPNNHRAHVFRSFEEYLASWYKPEDPKTQRKAKKIWNKHVEKNGNVPMVVKCAFCSGKELKEDRKAGRYKASRPSKKERDEMKGKE